MKRILVPALAALVVNFLLPAASAEPGDYDFTFGGDGRVLTDLGPNGDGSPIDAELEAIEVGGGRTIAVGSIESRFGVVRYDRSGKLDPTFHDDGWRTVEIFGGLAHATDVAIQSDGKIVVVGWAKNAVNEWAIVRLLPDGTLDGSFSSGDGIATVSFGSGAQEARGIAIDANGRIVVGGNSQGTSGGPMRFTAIRLTPDGHLDLSFNGTGKVAIDSGGGYARDIDTHGNKILLSGGRTETSSGDDELLFVRIAPNGALDPTFGGDGRVTIGFTGEPSWVEEAQVLPGGSVAAVAYPAFAVRLKENGKLDPTFSVDGKTFAGYDRVSGIVTSLIVEPNGAMIVGGNGWTRMSDAQWYLRRLKAGGGLDRSFGDEGQITTNFNGDDAGYFEPERVQDLDLLGDRRIVAAGITYKLHAGRSVPTRHFGIARYRNEQPSRTTLGIDVTHSEIKARGHVDPEHPNGDVIVRYYRVKAGTFGLVSKKVARLDAASSFDVSFGRGASGECKVKATFPGDLHHLASSATQTFAC